MFAESKLSFVRKSCFNFRFAIFSEVVVVHRFKDFENGTFFRLFNKGGISRKKAKCRANDSTFYRETQNLFSKDICGFLNDLFEACSVQAILSFPM